MLHIIFSKDNKASSNIAGRLVSKYGFAKLREGVWQAKAGERDVQLVQFSGSIVEIAPSFQSELLVYASTHRSESKKPCFTTHVPGNWGNADLGGVPRTLNICAPSAMKNILCKMNELSQKSELKWPVSLEVDHHGPTLSSPILFAEIGSGEEEWANEVAGEIVADAIMDGLASEKEFPAYLGFGGMHYASKFNGYEVGGSIALSHILPKYHAASFEREMLAQALEKCTQKAEGALVDWKGLGGEERQKVISILEEAGVKWKKA
ncbi:D-aminoacyl-tRNA deacylase [Candidatus Anstonella stagnisolia]|nr:D-aminoacyl-tRNA deacylase [Candidatus Anstonella stagnisolia]